MMASYSVAADWGIETFSVEYFSLPVASSNARFAQGRRYIFHRKELYHRGEWARQAYDVHFMLSEKECSGCCWLSPGTNEHCHQQSQAAQAEGSASHPAGTYGSCNSATCKAVGSGYPTLPLSFGGKNPTAGSAQSHGAPGSLACCLSRQHWESQGYFRQDVSVPFSSFSPEYQLLRQHGFAGLKGPRV